MTGPNDIWLVDSYALAWALVTADHWDGVQWTSIPMPVLGAPTIATAGPHFVWAVGWNDQILTMRH